MFSFKKKSSSLTAFLTGKVAPITEVQDEVFSTKMMGDGLAIIPFNEIVVSPGDAKVSVVMKDSKHAVGLTFKNGMEILLHVGLDTVDMKGEGFHVFVEEGDTVSAGDKLIQFDKNLIEERGFSGITMLVITNYSEFPKLSFHTGIDAIANETVIVTF